MSFLSFNTASGKHYCNVKEFVRHPLFKDFFVSIPQAVSTIAIMSKPAYQRHFQANSFNTASGKHYCNDAEGPAYFFDQFHDVSIPQAVSTIAMPRISLKS